METRSYEFLLEAQSPIAHHEGVQGNQAIAMTRKMRQSDGSFQRVPIVTADTMRHGLREAATYALLDAAGMLTADGAANGVLSEGALRLLFAGGMVTGKGDGSVIKLEAFHRLCELIPPLRILGGCCDNRVIPGTLRVDDAVLVCDESARYLPAWVQEWMASEKIERSSKRAHLESVQRVRMDPLLDPHKQKLLTPAARGLLTGRMETSEAGHETSDAVAISESKSSMMPRSYETIVQGSLFFWSLSAQVYSDLDADTLMTMLGAFFFNCVVGGKKGTGCGKMRAIAGTPARVSRPSDRVEVVDPKVLGRDAGKLFTAHVKERAAEIRQYLGDVNA